MHELRMRQKLLSCHCWKKMDDLELKDYHQAMLIRRVFIPRLIGLGRCNPSIHHQFTPPQNILRHQLAQSNAQ